MADNREMPPVVTMPTRPTIHGDAVCLRDYSRGGAEYWLVVNDLLQESNLRIPEIQFCYSGDFPYAVMVSGRLAYFTDSLYIFPDPGASRALCNHLSLYRTCIGNTDYYAIIYRDGYDANVRSYNTAIPVLPGDGYVGRNAFCATMARIYKPHITSRFLYFYLPTDDGRYVRLYRSPLGSLGKIMLRKSPVIGKRVIASELVSVDPIGVIGFESTAPGQTCAHRRYDWHPDLAVVCFTG